MEGRDPRQLVGTWLWKAGTAQSWFLHSDSRSGAKRSRAEPAAVAGAELTDQTEKCLVMVRLLWSAPAGEEGGEI